jgi:hypothetical protein
MAQKVKNPDETALTRAEFQYFKAYTRWRLGLRHPDKSRPLGNLEGLSAADGGEARRDEIDAMSDKMLRDFIR